MIVFDQLELEQLITHQVGSHSQDEGTRLSTAATQIPDATLEHLYAYLLHPFKSQEQFHFAHTTELELNPVYALVHSLFANPGALAELSGKLCQLLYQASNHPKVAAGQFHVALFTGAIVGDEEVRAIGLFKTETSEPFLRAHLSQKHFEIDHLMGTPIDSLDKGCLIVQSESADGYRILLVDTLGRGQPAQYWRGDFLGAKTVADEYEHTREYLSMAKQFVTRNLPAEFDTDRPAQAEMLNKSIAYFKENDTFDQQEFAETVFEHSNMRQAFTDYKREYQAERAQPLPDEFGISEMAVKQQAKGFKSVIKLDANFHIYVHGAREYIERGTDAEGRKFYKLYYMEEK